jgi:N-acetylneuraminic acid mutarotase
MDRCEDDSIFIDRDGEHFGQVLEYLRDGVLSVAGQDAVDLDVSVLRWLKREMGFYCIELMTEPQEVAFAVGGTKSYGELLKSVGRYDAASGAWREAAPMFTERSEFGLCELNGELYVSGGTIVDGEFAMSSVERYSPSLDTWSAAPAMPIDLHLHSACGVGDAMYVLGGVVGTGGEKEHTVSHVLKFDSRTQTWSEVAPMPRGRDFAGACVMGCNIYIFGGCDICDNEATSTHYRYSTETSTWATLAPMPEAKGGHSMCVLDGLIYVTGGDCSSMSVLDDVTGGEGSDESTLNSVHCFDLAAYSWSVRRGKEHVWLPRSAGGGGSLRQHDLQGEACSAVIAKNV